MRHPFFTMGLAAVVAIGIVTPAEAQNAGNAEAGYALAQQYCADCHDIESSGADKLYPPSFASIARFRTADVIKAKIMFPQLHVVTMPEYSMILFPGQIDDLVAYITSLDAS